MNLLKFEKLRFIAILIILFFLYFYLSASNYASAINQNLSNSVLRLHILANSNTPEDQALKYKVRDNILNYMNSISINVNSKTDALKLAQDNKEKFIEIAKNTITENGYDYDVNISFGNFYFPTKNYGDISFPAGNYDAIRIEIGEAVGQNWWCVMFPPLCFIDVSSGIVPDESKEKIKNNVGSEEFDIISTENETSNSDVIKFKFKLIELLNQSNFLFAKK